MKKIFWAGIVMGISSIFILVTVFPHLPVFDLWLVRVQKGGFGLLDLGIDKWAAWFLFGIVMGILSLFYLVMEFLHRHIKVST